MKKTILAMIVTVTLLLSALAIPTTALTPVGDIQIMWDADVSQKLDLTDGDLSDWEAAGYTCTTLLAGNFHAWTGDNYKSSLEDFTMDIYLVADPDFLYIALRVVDKDIIYDTDGANYDAEEHIRSYDGDAVQLSIDWGTLEEKHGDSEDMCFGCTKNIFYSFSSYGDGEPLHIVRQETYNNDGILSEANNDPVKGAASSFDKGNTYELAISWQMLYDDMTEKTDGIHDNLKWGIDSDLTIGLTLCYIDKNANGSYNWAGGTFDNAAPGWLATDNGMYWKLAYAGGRTLNCTGIDILPMPETTAPEETTAVPETTLAETIPDTTAAPTDTAVATDAPEESTANATAAAEVTTAEPTSNGGCSSVIRAGTAISLLTLAGAAIVIGKKRR